MKNIILILSLALFFSGCSTINKLKVITLPASANNMKKIASNVYVITTQEVLSATSIRVAHLGARSSYVARVEAGTGYQFPEHEKPPQHGCHQHGQHEGAEVRFTQN